MTWRSGEWDAVVLLLEECWRGDVTDRKMRAYRLMLDRFTARQVTDALQVLARSGRPFLPTVPEIIAVIEADPTLPAWGEAYALIERAMRLPTEADTLARLDAQHPLLALFVAATGWDRLRMLPVNHPEYGPLEVRRLGEEYREFIGRARERQQHGLPAVSDRTGRLGRLDPAAALPRGAGA